ncbi:MAG: two-component system response regulator AtoC [Myxococcota bacterium]|jgi:two-component system response regulator AtoC
MAGTTIVVCDDEELIRWSLCEHLNGTGYRTVPATNGAECVEAVAAHAPGLVLMDLKMPVMDGLTALRRLREAGSEVPVIVITAHGAVDSAIEATHLGAVAYLSKPFDLREVSLAVERALEEHRLRSEVHYLRTRDRTGYGDFIGQSPALASTFNLLARLERVDAPTVLIMGESGTGKDLIARSIHEKGPRRRGPFMEIDCAAMPEQLIESQLFGHERGAFTDARSTKPGLFEVASGGVVFLDEIGEMSLGTQAKLLRALENRTFKRVGGVATISMDVAIVAATNRNLKQEVQSGNFREDLYFRLNVVPLVLPPLRERSEDVPLLVEFFIERFNRMFGRHVRGISGEAMVLLQGYAWPGNVRELRNVLERIIILGADDVLGPKDLPPEIRYARTSGSGAGVRGCPFVLPDDGVNLEDVEKGLLVQALERTNGNQSAAARMLGISRYALRYRMEKYELTDS